MLRNTVQLFKTFLTVFFSSFLAPKSVSKLTRVGNIVANPQGIHSRIPALVSKAVYGIAFILSFLPSGGDDGQVNQISANSDLEVDLDTDASLCVQCDAPALSKASTFGQSYPSSAHEDPASIGKVAGSADRDHMRTDPETSFIAELSFDTIEEADEGTVEEVVERSIVSKEGCPAVSSCQFYALKEDEYADESYHPEELAAPLPTSASLIEVKQGAKEIESFSIPNGEFKEYMASLHESPTTEIGQWRKWVQKYAQVDAKDDHYIIPFPFTPVATPSSKPVAPQDIQGMKEGIVADLSGLVSSAGPPESPSLSECSSVDSPLISTPSMDLYRFTEFKFPVVSVSASPHAEIGLPTANHLLKGVSSTISFSDLLAASPSDVNSPANMEPSMIPTANCLFEGISCHGSYETLYLKLDPNLSPQTITPCVVAPPPAPPSQVVRSRPFPYSMVPQLTTAQIGNSRATDESIFVGPLSLWLRISSLFIILLFFFFSS